MSRVIKFRQWVPRLNQYIGFWGNYEAEDGSFWNGPASEPKGIHEQWTGLQDSKGVDIYEGDICRVSIKGLGITVVSEMKFFPDYSMFAFSSVPHYYENKTENKPMGSSGSSTPWKPYMPGSYKYIEVIGNIHATPELLRTK
jgi:uncharacterized phage protein (TIGR01671 family)